MTNTEQTAITGHPILLYDGVCGLCNRVVQLLLRIRGADTFRFVPLESPLGRELLTTFPTPPTEPEGVILLLNPLTPRQHVYRRFDAVSESLQLIGGPWIILAFLLRLTPRPLREYTYGLIARHRYATFGRFDTCPIPTQAQRSRILGM
jgi:predicted DCC family thiol-disulfide oxidoreductase YuxK